jgi:hypothetical protein
LLKQEQGHPRETGGKSYAIESDGLSDWLGGWFAEEATNFRGSVRYGFVATRFRGRLIGP